MATVSGSDIVVKFGDAGSEVVVACSTNATLTISQADTGRSCKDSEWKGTKGGEKSWSVSVDALYQSDDAADSGGFVDLSDLIITGPNSCTVVIGGTESGDNIWTGVAVLTECTLNGPDKEDATYSASFMGDGPLVHSVLT